MTDLVNQIGNSTTEICLKLNELLLVLSQRDYFGVIAPWILSLVSAFFGYFISSRNEKRAFKRDCHIKYLTFTNNFLVEINSVIVELENLQKLGFLIMDYINNPSAANPYFYGNLNDYNSVVTKIRDLRTEIGKMKKDETVYSTKQEYIKHYIEQSDDVLEFNKFINLCTKFQQESANYYYLISKSLRKEHADLINTLAKATQNNMNEFNIEDYKKQLYDHILHINKQIVGHKIKEPNWFNQNDSEDKT